jgi:hypothetical protein
LILSVAKKNQRLPVKRVLCPKWHETYSAIKILNTKKHDKELCLDQQSFQKKTKSKCFFGVTVIVACVGKMQAQT